MILELFLHDSTGVKHHSHYPSDSEIRKKNPFLGWKNPIITPNFTPSAFKAHPLQTPILQLELSSSPIPQGIPKAWRLPEGCPGGG